MTADADTLAQQLTGQTLHALQTDPALGLPDRLETKILLCHVLQLPRSSLITQDRRCLTALEAAQLAQLITRRRQGEPIAYITGQREFYGLNFLVDASVLIPRPETELLVDLALENLPRHARILDLGTGSGAIAITLAHTRPDAHVTALERSPQALACARKNAENLLQNPLPHSLHLLQSDWYSALSAQNPAPAFDLIVSNPPYIRRGDPHLSQGDLRFEPGDALTDYHDGFTAIRTIIEGAPNYLTQGGRLWLEHGYDQAETVTALLRQRGFSGVQSRPDLAGILRVSGGVWHHTKS